MKNRQRVQNYMNYAEKLRREYRRGMPDGLDESYFKQIDFLFKRIDELENALVPFARTADRERDFGGDLYQVNARDCERALDVIDKDNAVPIKREKTVIPGA